MPAVERRRVERAIPPSAALPRLSAGAGLLAFVLAVPCALAAQGTAPAAPPPYYETATVYARPLDSATASVTVLDRAAIDSSEAATVTELLRFVPGLDVTASGGRGGLATVQIRGGDPNFSLVLLDGVPQNDPTYQVGDVFDLAGMPASSVERVEVVRGPLSAFYGSTGLAGAVNIITREPKPGLAGRPAVQGEVGGGSGSRESADGTVASGWAGGASYLLGGGWEQEEHLVAREDFRQASLFGRLALPLPIGKLRLNGRYAAWDADDYPDASGGPLFGSGLLRTSEHREWSFGGELQAGDPERPQRLTAAFYRHDLDRDSPAVPPQVPASTEATVYTLVRAGWASTLYSGARTQLNGGVDVTRERGENASLLLLPPFLGGDVAGDYALARTLGGAFAELSTQLGRSSWELGTRLDLPEGHSAELSPRLGASFRLDDETRLRASVGRAFKLPSFFAVASPRALGGNPLLRPETAWGGDLGLERTFAAAHLTASLTAFYNRFKDLIDFDFQQFLHVNRAAVEARGAELALAWKPLPRLSIDTNATWQEVEDLTTGGPLKHRPRWVGGARIRYQADERWDLQLDSQAVARMVDEQIPVADRFTVAGYQVWGLAASCRLAGGWRLAARADNLLDRGYETLIGFPGAGRSFRLGLRYTREP